MSIRPISSVSFNNYNNVSFEGRKKNRENKHSSNHTATTPIKAVPLAVLLAMSPMVGQSVDVIEQVPVNGVENVQKTHGIIEIENGVYPGTKCKLVVNENADGTKDLALGYTQSYKTTKNIDGEKVKIRVLNDKTVMVNGLKIANVTVENAHGATTANLKKYYVTGNMHSLVRCYYDDEPTKFALPTTGKLIKNVEVEVYEEVYNKIKNIMGDAINYSTENKTETDLGIF